MPLILSGDLDLQHGISIVNISRKVTLVLIEATQYTVQSSVMATRKKANVE